jgi:hypothetical protein
MVSLLFAVILLHLGLRGHESRLVVLAESPLVVLSLSCNFSKVRTLKFRNATASLRKHRTVPRRAFSDVVSLHDVVPRRLQSQGSVHMATIATPSQPFNAAKPW